ncbi:MAG: site-specific integrase [Candidatus Hadarchaeales archaeon]
MKLTYEALDRWLSKVLPTLSPGRRKTLERYVQYMLVRGFSFHTIMSNLTAVLSLGFDGKPYEELGEADLAAWVSTLSRLRPESQASYKRRVKAFLRWVHGLGPRDESPPFLKVLRSRSQRDLPKQVLTEEEAARLVAACESLRNRALVHVLYESGGRASEVLGLKIGDVEFDELGAVIVVKGKTGSRRIRLIESVPDLQRWLAVHPDKNNPDAPLWPGRNGGPISVEFLNTIVKRAAARAGITKRVHPHALRHARATHMAKFLSEYQLRAYFGWTKSSNVPARYIHLAGKDLDATLASHYGLMQQDGRRACPRCGFLNPQGAVYCARCSAILSAVEAVRRQTLEEEIVGRVLQKLIELAPDILEKALTESGAIERLREISSPYQNSAAGGNPTIRLKRKGKETQIVA